MPKFALTLPPALRLFLVWVVFASCFLAGFYVSAVRCTSKAATAQVGVLKNDSKAMQGIRGARDTDLEKLNQELEQRDKSKANDCAGMSLRAAVGL